MSWKIGSTDERLYAPATERNREAILSVLKSVLPTHGKVLEIASGTGEHITFWAPHFPELTWQPSDPDPMHVASIASWMKQLPSANILSPLQLDVMNEAWGIDAVDVILCINMIHIAPWEACLGLLRGAQSLLAKGGLLYLYGPFKQQGKHTAPSNESFDLSLRAQEPSWGVRDLEEVIDVAQQHDLHFQQVIPMPANNLSVVFRRRFKDD
jgi:Protein of unknown function (DUF938)